jgi:hypothetical protein
VEGRLRVSTMEFVGHARRSRSHGGLVT